MSVFGAKFTILAKLYGVYVKELPSMICVCVCVYIYIYIYIKYEKLLHIIVFN